MPPLRYWLPLLAIVIVLTLLDNGESCGKVYRAVKGLPRAIKNLPRNIRRIPKKWRNRRANQGLDALVKRGRKANRVEYDAMKEASARKEVIRDLKIVGGSTLVAGIAGVGIGTGVMLHKKGQVQARDEDFRYEKRRRR